MTDYNPDNPFRANCFTKAGHDYDFYICVADLKPGLAESESKHFVFLNVRNDHIYFRPYLNIVNRNSGFTNRLNLLTYARPLSQNEWLYIEELPEIYVKHISDGVPVDFNFLSKDDKVIKLTLSKEEQLQLQFICSLVL